MNSKIPAVLTSYLIASKGEASPSTTEPVTPPEAPQPFLQPRVHKKQGTIAVTVRLDPDLYEQLKKLGYTTGLTNQDILVQALNSFIQVTS